MGISVSAKCSKRTFKDEFDEFDERSSALTISANTSQIPIPRLNIPSESASTSSASNDAPSAAAKKEAEDIVEVEEKEVEIETLGWKPQTMSAEQASLSWACDVYSKESDQIGMGWASQIDGDHLNCFENRDAKALENSNYSPMPANNSTNAFPRNFIVKSIPTKPRDERNFIWRNKKNICYAGKPKSGSYCHLMKSIIRAHKEASSNSGQTDLGNQFDSPNSHHADPIVEQEKMLYEQRMDLYRANDFVREATQGKTHQISGHCVQLQDDNHIPVSEPNVPRRPVKLINFKILNRYCQVETKSPVTKFLHSPLFTQWCGEVQSSRMELGCHETPKASHDSMGSQAVESRIREKSKAVLNKTRLQNAPTSEDSEKKKSKREIMMEYSKTVAVANLVRDRKGILKVRQKPSAEHISALDEEIAKILDTYETRPQRIASRHSSIGISILRKKKGRTVANTGMTEIGFSLYGNGFVPGPMDGLIDSFWMDSSTFLEPAFGEIKPISPGSTKSTSSLDSLLQGTSNTPSDSTTSLPPWRNDLEKRVLPASSERKGGNFGDPVNSLWQSDGTCECHLTPATLPPPSTLPDQQQTKKTALLATDLLQGFDETEATSTSDGLEEQLASADNAWTAALELPDITVEDAGHLLAQTQNSNSRTFGLPYRRTLRRRRFRRNALKSIEVQRPFANFTDPESTETGSEGEEDHNKEASPQRNRSRIFIEGRVEVVEDLCSSEVDDSDEEGINRSPTKKAGICSSSQPASTLPPRHSQSTKIDYMEPWWPQRSSSVFQRLNARELDACSGVIGRNRRQLELWEFILRSLDARPIDGTTSAFKWVNRSVGVFRVTDTQKAAKEWGLYRGNERMDYEKMARAMRFYYKECVLRKARKQLHFQFSMPFVAWSKRYNYYESVSTSAS
ncbi:DNA-binding protein D-ETS-4 [Taenia crassiceps]|uniref:DNA-binding protein D-ETS-4 n=1 Tax=Taenia crassiceps TaxID=6207 RepID=A0ABR4QLX7_9CEST